MIIRFFQIISFKFTNINIQIIINKKKKELNYYKHIYIYMYKQFYIKIKNYQVIILLKDLFIQKYNIENLADIKKIIKWNIIYNIIIKLLKIDQKKIQ